MKARERSERAAELVALLTAKFGAQDESPLCRLVASYMAQVVSDAQYRDCIDEKEVSEIEDRLDRAYRTWMQYEGLRDKSSPLAPR
jgi:hypothetical protein